MWLFITGVVLGIMVHRHYVWKTIKDAEAKINGQPAQPEQGQGKLF